MENMIKTKIFVLLLTIVMLTSCSEEKPPEQEVIRPVRYQVVSTSVGGTQTRNFSGTAKSGLESNLSFKVGGTISRINVKVGDQVKKGKLIATLDSKDYQLQVQQVEAQLEQGKALELNAKADYERVRGLYESQNASKSDLDASRAAYKSASASVRATEKQLELTRSQSQYTKLIAPFNGVVSAVNADVNENIGAGTPVVVLTGQVAQTEVEVAIPETVIAQIQRDMEVSVTFEAVPNKTFRGLVTEVGIVTSQISSTYPVTVALQTHDPNVRAGMVADVVFTFELPDKGERMIIPSHAVMEDQKGRYVFIAQPLGDGIATTKRVDVTVGTLSSEGMEITSGLSDGQFVVTAGVSRIKEDMKVKLLETKE